MLWRMLASLKIVCANNEKVRPDGTCEWTGCYNDYQKHIANCGCHPQPPPATGSTAVSSPPQHVPSCGREGARVDEVAVEQRANGLRAAAQPPLVLGTVPPQQAVAGHTVCRATSAFDQEGSEMVLVHVGDVIQIVSKLPSGWSYCHNLTTSATGWAPSWVAQHVEETSTAVDLARVPTSAPVSLQQLQPVAWQRPTPPAWTGGKAASATATCPVTATVPAARNEALRPQQKHETREATAFFTGADDKQLSLAPGDLVEVVQCVASGWIFGRLVLRPGALPKSELEGWFPDWACAPTGAQRLAPASGGAL